MDHEAWVAASANSATVDLRRIALIRPDLRDVLANNPKACPLLNDWLSQIDNQDNCQNQ